MKLWSIYNKNRKIITRISGLFVISILLAQLIVPHLYITSTSVNSSNFIRVLTYNVHDSNPDQLSSVLKNIDADIIGLQEINQTPDESVIKRDLEELAIELDLFLINSQNYNYSTYGLALLSRFPVDESSFLELSSFPLSNPRGVFQAFLSFPQGSVQVLLTHLNTPNFYFTRVNQVNGIIDKFEINSNTVLIGDLNTPNSVLEISYHRLMSHFQDSWVVAGNHPATGKTYPSFSPTFRVDYILVSEDVRVVETSANLICYTSISDHLGVYADIVIAN